MDVFEVCVSDKVAACRGSWVAVFLGFGFEQPESRVALETEAFCGKSVDDESVCCPVGAVSGDLRWLDLVVELAADEEGSFGR